MTSSNTPKADKAPAMAAMADINPMATKAWMDILSDNARFMTERLQQDMETQKALLACKTPAELLQVQTEFFKSAMAQYTEHATRMFTKASATTEETVKTARSSQSRGYDDVPV